MNGFAKSLLLAFLCSLTGCCQVAPPHREPPPPISLQEQARQLEAWSAQLPVVRATTVLAGVRFDYRDDKGQKHSDNAEGRLLLQSSGTGHHDVLLMGSAYDQPVFEAGRNDSKWWFVLKVDAKKAWVGDATRPLDPATLSAASQDSASILRADLVPQLLALSPLPAVVSGSTFSSNTTSNLMLMVHDEDATSHLLVARVPGISGGFGGAAFTTSNGYVEREIIIDRFTGHVTEVRVYDAAGVVAVRSILENYQPATYAADATKSAGPPPQFPHKVTVTYPAQQMTIAMQFDKVTVLGKAPPTAFQTPTFEGLRVINVP